MPSTTTERASVAAVSATERYLAALEQYGVEPAPIRAHVTAICTATDWEHPTTAIDFNNLAVLALLDVEVAIGSAARAAALGRAIDLLIRGNERESSSLCAVHIALLQLLVDSQQQAGPLLEGLLPPTLALSLDDEGERQAGLLYLPRLPWHQWPQTVEYTTLLGQLLRESNGATQQALFLGALLSLPWYFYGHSDVQRWLVYAQAMRPQSAALALRLGLNLLHNRRREGIYYLRRAIQLAPNYASAHQALFLAYRGLGDVRTAEAVHASARTCAIDSDPAWRWIEAPLEAPWTYLPSEAQTPIAVEASIANSLTLMLLAEPHWRESEYRWWCEQIGSDMIVVDVGANIGHYTVAAAQRVGPQGRVIAVEPFADCVRCLRETIRLNGYTQVTIARTALSDRQGTVAMKMTGSSDTNQVVEGATAAGQASVPCSTLDHLCERASLAHIDLLKIDVEGHELAVLQGARSILATNPPIILYENGTPDAPNAAVAAFLRERGYRFFIYRPFLRDLHELGSTADLRGIMNVIAIPEGKVAQYLS